MKKWIPLLFVTVLMLLAGAGWASAAAKTAAAAKTTAAAPVPKLYLNGKELASQVPPALIQDSVLVPIRTVAENLGYEVGWDGKTKQVTVKEGSTEISMTLGETVAKVNGKSVQLTAPPVLQSDTTLIPIRFVGETFGLQIMWDNSSKSAFLYTDAGTKPAEGGQPGNGAGGGTDAGQAGDAGSAPVTNPGSGNGNNAGTGDGPPTDGNSTDGGLVGVVEPEDEGNAHSGTGEADSGKDAGVGIPASVHQLLYEPNLISVSYEGSVAPVSSVLGNPDRIVIDLPNADFADDFTAGYANGITPGIMIVNTGRPEPGTVPELAGVGHEVLDKIRYSQFSDSPKTLRFVLDLNRPWGYEVDTQSFPGKMFIRLKEPSGAPAKSGYTVVLDAGHGGSDPGARSITGKWEKEFTLSVVKKVQEILSNSAKINLVLTREGDTYPTLDDRVNLANDLQADLFLSVHGNSFTAATNGTETYYTRADSLEFAKLLHKNAVAATGFKDNGVRTANYKVTRATTMPAVLLEVGYLTNASNEKQMYDDGFQYRVAQAIAASIMQYFNLS